MDGLEGSDVVYKLKEKELLEFEFKSFQIRQVGVYGDPPDPMLAGAWYELVELPLAMLLDGCFGVPLNDLEGRLVAIIEVDLM
ncbi:hypothetical protein F2Q69_00006984 [Brassica cretica]|uniref:Uncharacterized protein n=1 Tax=Brassica cretica TaxID=69181 RepID=A0A8S9PHZ0_BRACR|nr:hypothetical protein F2Q69_00006984 [Brassica cretica]